ncbi:MAG: AIR synthase related protein [Candidatus Thorarchaeota archaeon]
MTDLTDIIKMLREFEGISRKFILPSIIGKLREESYQGNTPHGLGEDSAAIGTESDEVILLTTDSIVQELCLNHPHAAGFNVVLANVMDIYAAGGTPTSFAVALSYSDQKIGDELLQGLIEGTHTFRVPLVRGHTSSQASSTYVVGSATGTVKKTHLLTAGGAQEGDQLILIFDKEGKRGSSYTLGWDTVTHRDSSQVTNRLTVMIELAQSGLISASKDISVAGLVGTAGMMVEYSGMGGSVDLDSVEKNKPPSINFRDWIRMFISLGFLVAAPSTAYERINSIAHEHEMSAVVIGTVDDSRSLRLRMGAEEEILFDFSKGPILTPKGK